MKKSELQELLRLITKKVIKEYAVMPSSTSSTSITNNGTDINADPSTPPDDTMTAVQKSAEKRKKSAELQHDLKATADAQKSAKAEASMYRQKSAEYEKYKKKDFKNKVDTIKNQISLIREKYN
jgi:hypothetical protein